VRARGFGGFLAAAILAGCAPQTGAPAAPAAGFGGVAARPSDLTVTPLNVPASQFPTATTTELTGIRGDLISATVTLSGGATVGAVYSRTAKSWTQLQVPGSASTAAYGPALARSGYRIVGSYKDAASSGDRGFAYDSATKRYSTIDAPAKLCAPKSCNYTIAHSAYGTGAYQVVGNYDAVDPYAGAAPEGTYPASGHAFLYDSATRAFSTIDVPGAISTTAYGIWIDGSTTAVAGGYTDGKGVHAYVRALGSKKDMLVYNYPHAAITHFEGITGNGGAGNYNVVGDYSAARNAAVVYGFFLTVSDWKAGTPVVIGKVSANSVYGRTAVGIYQNDGKPSGYYVSVPVVDPP